MRGLGLDYDVLEFKRVFKVPTIEKPVEEVKEETKEVIFSENPTVLEKPADKVLCAEAL